MTINDWSTTADYVMTVKGLVSSYQQLQKERHSTKQ